jgi:Fe-S cluster assembly protein SufD
LLNDVLKKNETGFNKISAITAGLGRHGFLLYIPKQLKVEKPIEITALVKKAKIFLPACGFIILGEQASASIILRYTSELSDKDSAVLSLNVLASVGEAADLQFLEIQKLGKKVWNFVTEKSILGKQANLERFMLDSGGTVNKRSFSVDLREEGGQATVTGVYKPQADQVYIYDTEQNHLASKTSSNLFFSGVLKNDAYSLWKGNVYVAEGTRGADGFQINKNLLLDEAAHAESIPGLEILADDVRCSHAVTLSSVDAEQMFFLESRGIGPVEAEELIVNGFLEAASNRMKDKALKEIILDALK